MIKKQKKKKHTQIVYKCFGMVRYTMNTRNEDNFDKFKNNNKVDWKNRLYIS